MNVRFFGGRKSEYVSIPKHNPIGLYFCADTRELFLGDRLLSDGLRVVPTFADLPSISEHKAAEGIIYFVEATKNGYVLPRGRAEWLQVIYAPTSGEGGEADLSNYYTKAEVDEAILKAIANIEIEVDLADYATKEDVASVEAKIPTDYLKEIPTEYITETELSEAITGLATEEYVNAAIQGIEIPVVPTKVSELENDAGYLTTKDIPAPELYVINFDTPNFVEAVEAYKAGKLLLLANAAPDVNSYAVMNYVRDDIITFTKFLMSRSGTYGAFNTYYLHSDNTWELAKEVKLNKVEAVADADNNINGLVIGKNTYDFDNFATAETVNQINQNIENIQNTYVTNETLEQKNYVTDEQVTEVVTNEVETVVTEQIETKVTEVIQEKIDTGEITVSADRITYGEF